MSQTAGSHAHEQHCSVVVWEHAIHMINLPKVTHLVESERVQQPDPCQDWLLGIFILPICVHGCPSARDSELVNGNLSTACHDQAKYATSRGNICRSNVHDTNA